MRQQVIGWPWWPPLFKLRELKIMENLNFNDDAVIDPKDAEIAELREQLENANRRADMRGEQLDQFGKAIMGVIGDSVLAVAESVAGDTVENALNDFDISNYECEIGDMIDERLPEGLDDESRADDLTKAITEILPTLNLSLSVD
jgi:hypothetical protein